MNVKAVKESFEELFLGKWTPDYVDKIVELDEYFALTLSGRDNFNCLFFNKSDGSRHGTDKCNKAFKTKIREFTFEEFSEFLEEELKRVS